MSSRREKKFISINLATLSENILESELFGHERGAFSGADTKRIGKLEIGNGGTIFLDEIGELNPRLQTKLLETLNSKIISPVGSNREIELDIRIITATNRDLSKMVRDGQFREDLFFRLNTFQIDLPDLKGDKQKIHSLANRFLAEASKTQNKEIISISELFFLELFEYTWPGNIRELKNAIDFAVALSCEGRIEKDALPPYVKANKNAESTVFQNPINHFPMNYYEAKSQFERLYFQEMLKQFSGKINLTSRKTGVSKVTLIEKVKRYEIDVNTIKYKAVCAQKEIQ